MNVLYSLKIKETTGRVVTPIMSYDLQSDPGPLFVENFFGCHESGVMSFTIKRTVCVL